MCAKQYIKVYKPMEWKIGETSDIRLKISSSFLLLTFPESTIPFILTLTYYCFRPEIRLVFGYVNENLLTHFCLSNLVN